MSDFPSRLPVRTEQNGDIVAKICDASTDSQQLKVNADGSLDVNVKNASLTVEANDLDIRPLTNADVITAEQGSNPWHVDVTAALPAGDNNIGNVDVVSLPALPAGNNNIGDVDVASLPALPAGDNNIGNVDIVSLPAVDVQSLPAIPAGDNNIGNVDIVSLPADIDIRDLTAASDSIKAHLFDEAGNAFTTANPLPVEISEAGGQEVHDFLLSNLAAAASGNHDYVAPAGFKLNGVLCAASTRAKFELQVESAAASGIFNTVAVAFTSSSEQNYMLDLMKIKEIATGAKVRVIKTNMDKATSDIYSTIVGVY